MRKIILAAALAVTAGSWTLAQGPPRDRPAAAPFGTATISGRVTIQSTKPAAPVRRARITDPEVLRRLRSGAVAVAVVEKDTQTVTLKLKVQP